MSVKWVRCLLKKLLTFSQDSLIELNDITIYNRGAEQIHEWFDTNACYIALALTAVGVEVLMRWPSLKRRSPQGPSCLMLRH